MTRTQAWEREQILVAQARAADAAMDFDKRDRLLKQARELYSHIDA